MLARSSEPPCTRLARRVLTADGIRAARAAVAIHYFVGFEFGGPETLASCKSVFSEPGAEHSLGAWHEDEFGHPRTFSAMYQFWVSKPTAV